MIHSPSCAHFIPRRRSLYLHFPIARPSRLSTFSRMPVASHQYLIPSRAGEISEGFPRSRTVSSANWEILYLVSRTFISTRLDCSVLRTCGSVGVALHRVCLDEPRKEKGQTLLRTMQLARQRTLLAEGACVVWVGCVLRSQKVKKIDPLLYVVHSTMEATDRSRGQVSRSPQTRARSDAKDRCGSRWICSSQSSQYRTRRAPEAARPNEQHGEQHGEALGEALAGSSATRAKFIAPARTPWTPTWAGRGSRETPIHRGRACRAGGGHAVPMVVRRMNLGRAPNWTGRRRGERCGKAIPGARRVPAAPWGGGREQPCRSGRMMSAE